MRNWNEWWTSGDWRRGSGYQPTYEELKQESEGKQYPNFSRYQPTYEELKRQIPGQLQPGCFRYQPTYEELKLSSYRLLLLLLCSYQPTYEELKLCYIFSTKNYIIWLPAYLWGIETLNTHLLEKMLLWLPATMRWNFDPHEFDEAVALPAYLWGETKNSSVEWGAGRLPAYQRVKRQPPAFFVADLSYQPYEVKPHICNFLLTSKVTNTYEELKRNELVEIAEKYGLPAYLYEVKP